VLMRRFQVSESGFGCEKKGCFTCLDESMPVPELDSRVKAPDSGCALTLACVV
jgi:hypothetical protein